MLLICHSHWWKCLFDGAFRRHIYRVCSPRTVCSRGNSAASNGAVAHDDGGVTLDDTCRSLLSTPKKWKWRQVRAGTVSTKCTKNNVSKLQDYKTHTVPVLSSSENIWANCCWWLFKWWHHQCRRGNCVQYPGLYWFLSWLLYANMYAPYWVSPWVTIVGARWIVWKSSVQETTKYVCPFYHRMTVTIVLTQRHWQQEHNWNDNVAKRNTGSAKSETHSSIAQKEKGRSHCKSTRQMSNQSSQVINTFE